jgi:ATP-dependent Lon protease
MLVFPEANRKDVEELPDYLRKGIDFRYTGRFDDLLAVALGGRVPTGTPRG